MAQKIEKLPNKTPRPIEGHKPAAAVLRDVVDKVYANAWEAKRRGELVGWSSSKFPIELAKAFDLNVVYPENHAASTAAKKDGLRLCQAAEDMGYDNDICGYARISIAYAAGEPTDSRRMPQPDFLLCCNNICNMMTKWYENIARIHNIPLIMVDIPFSNTVDTPEEKVDYLIGQFDHAIKQLEELTGKKFDEKKFEDACARANRTAAAWLKSCNYMSYKPSPLSGFDLFNHMADIVASRCEEEAAIGFELLAGERRFRASKIAGLEVVPAIIKELTDQEMMRQAIIENLQREDLNPIEEAISYQKLVDHGYKHDQIAQFMGKSRPYISNMLRLLQLSPLVQEAVIQHDISSAHARVLVPLDEEEQRFWLEKIKQDHLNVRTLENKISSKRKQKKSKSK